MTEDFIRRTFPIGFPVMVQKVLRESSYDILDVNCF